LLLIIYRLAIIKYKIIFFLWFSRLPSESEISCYSLQALYSLQISFFDEGRKEAQKWMLTYLKLSFVYMDFPKSQKWMIETWWNCRHLKLLFGTEPADEKQSEIYTQLFYWRWMATKAFIASNFQRSEYIKLPRDTRGDFSPWK